MCATKQPSLRDVLANLRKPVPLSEKLRLVAVNTMRKLFLRQSCCGNHGQPGC